MFMKRVCACIIITVHAIMIVLLSLVTDDDVCIILFSGLFVYFCTQWSHKDTRWKVSGI